MKNPNYSTITKSDISRTFGYIRVSTREQNEARQVMALHDFGITDEHIFMDKLSGKDFNRPAYQELIHSLQPGDVLVIKSIDRLGRNYEEILDQWRIITKEKQAAIVVLDMPLLDTRSNRLHILTTPVRLGSRFPISHFAITVRDVPSICARSSWVRRFMLRTVRSRCANLVPLGVSPGRFGYMVGDLSFCDFLIIV